jgi:hypothetical protein
VHANITAQRKPISATAYAYVPHHNELGRLGKSLLSACISGCCNVTSLVHGQPGDQLTEQRCILFEPPAKKLAALF